MGIETLHQAELWVERYLDWCGFWADFLEDEIGCFYSSANREG